ncbi:LYR motif-containing protein 5B [Salvelinus sp. IW2-2015]|uniref:LYR motif-containing protein 5B n=1 Tax=Salvelinus sp. IW2-2015 TaxID=2691554 RepID=UPI0038D41C46
MTEETRNDADLQMVMRYIRKVHVTFGQWVIVTVLLLQQLLYLGREYPKGAGYFRDRLKSAFLNNKDVKDPKMIKQIIARGEFVIKELEALYYLRKYRAMKKRYYEPEE